MIPYLEQPVVKLGPLPVHAFGVLVAIALLVGSAMAHRRARATGVPEPLLADIVTWVVVGAFLMAHVLDCVFYFPRETAADPLRLFRLWDGLSSFGGFVGAATGGLLYLAKPRAKGFRWQAIDAVAYGFPFGWVFGRLGCFLAFDHPGKPTASFIGQRFRDGVVRHNLGLEEALFTIIVAVSFLVLGRAPRRPGFFVGLLALLYAPVRFALDTLRIDDARYGTLTPGQYGSLVLAIGGAIILWARRPDAEAPLTAAAR